MHSNQCWISSSLCSQSDLLLGVIIKVRQATAPLGTKSLSDPQMSQGLVSPETAWVSQKTLRHCSTWCWPFSRWHSSLRGQIKQALGSNAMTFRCDRCRAGIPSSKYLTDNQIPPGMHSSKQMAQTRNLKIAQGYSPTLWRARVWVPAYKRAQRSWDYYIHQMQDITSHLTDHQVTSFSEPLLWQARISFLLRHKSPPHGISW